MIVVWKYLKQTNTQIIVAESCTGAAITRQCVIKYLWDTDIGLLEVEDGRVYLYYYTLEAEARNLSSINRKGYCQIVYDDNNFLITLNNFWQYVYGEKNDK